jgi:hypothetical protein
MYLFSFRDHIVRSNSEPRFQIVGPRGDAITKTFVPVDSVFQKTLVIKATECCSYAVLSPGGDVSGWYEKIGDDADGFRIVSNWKYYGVINSGMDVIIPVAQEKIEYAGGQFLVTTKDTTVLYDTTGRLLTPGYSQMNYAGAGIYRAKNGNDAVYTLYDQQGTMISRSYAQVYNFHCGTARVVNADTSLFAYIDTRGRIISRWYPCAVDFHKFTGGGAGGAGSVILRVFLGGASAGASEAVIASKENSGSGDARVSDNDLKNAYRGEYYYFNGRDFQNGYSVYTERRKAPVPNAFNEEPVYYGLLDSSGREITKAEYVNITPLDTFFIIEKPSGRGLMTRSGKIILQPLYGNIRFVRDAYFMVDKDPMTWFHSALYHYDGSTGKFLTVFRYSEILDGGDSAFILKEYGDYGYADAQGKFFISMKYENAEPFKDGKARVRLDRFGEYFYVERNGKRLK